jgi:limonene-1,2-epoxide hydrolase
MTKGIKKIQGPERAITTTEESKLYRTYTHALVIRIASDGKACT